MEFIIFVVSISTAFGNERGNCQRNEGLLQVYASARHEPNENELPQLLCTLEELESPPIFIRNGESSDSGSQLS